ncbi:MAG: ABC transporter ATP-binding protein [Ornithinimicrobium sp.]
MGTGFSGGPVFRMFGKDKSVTKQTLQKGTARRVLTYGAAFKREITIFLILTIFGASLVVATPLLLGRIIDEGVREENRGVVIGLGSAVAVLAVIGALLVVVTRWYSSRIGEGLILNLRTQVFGHVLRQPIAFFTRAQTGALVNRLNTDVIGAQTAFTSILSGLVSNVVTLTFVGITLVSLSWQITLPAVLLLPLFLIPASFMGRRLSTLTRKQMNLNSELASRMTERFNVAGAMLVRLFGRPQTEADEYAERAQGVRDAGVAISVNRVIFAAGLGLVASLATALVYGFGGLLAISSDSFSVGKLVAMSLLLGSLYGPLTALSNARVDVMTALVSFERIFEILDLEPLVAEAKDPVTIPDGRVGIRLEGVDFTYPAADEVAISSLELRPDAESLDRRQVLFDIDLDIKAGSMVALVGPSGAGKSTLTTLISRLYDPVKGSVRIGDVNLRDASFDSLRDTVGVVTQEAHMFNDTIRANLLYASPEATEEQMEVALRGAQVWNLVDNLPDRLDTVLGDRGHRLSGGEKQRLAIARLLLKSPSVVVLDEATAHLDSESELAVQRALDEALSGRTSIVIAHRLSTVRDADTIVVLDRGRVVQQGTHDELLERGGMYQMLYETQFSRSGAASSPA